MATNEQMIDALLIERAGYERMGKADRAAQVTAALKARGYEDPRTAPDADAATTRGRRTAKG
jgi:hypothetical protein